MSSDVLNTNVYSTSFLFDFAHPCQLRLAIHRMTKSEMETGGYSCDVLQPGPFLDLDDHDLDSYFVSPSSTSCPSTLIANDKIDDHEEEEAMMLMDDGWFYELVTHADFCCVIEDDEENGEEIIDLNDN